MTACVNRKHTKKVAAVVTASLVGALSLGVAPMAAVADTGIETLAADWFTGATVTKATDGKGAAVSNPSQATFAPNSGKYLVPTELTNSFGDVTIINPDDYDITYYEDDQVTQVSVADFKNSAAGSGTFYLKISTKTTPVESTGFIAFKIGETSVADDITACLDGDATKTSIVYTGMNQASDIDFADANGNIVATGASATWKTANGDPVGTDGVKSAGTYYAEVTVGTETVTVKVVVSALDLTTASLTFADTVAGPANAAAFLSALKVNGSTLANPSILKVTSVENADGNADWSAKGPYTVTVASNSSSNVKGTATITFSNLDDNLFSTGYSVYYGSKPVTGGQISISLVDGESFDASKVKVYNPTSDTTYTGDKLELTFEDSEGNVVAADAITEDDTYTMHVRVKPFKTFAGDRWQGGSQDVDVVLTGTQLNSDKNLAFYLDGELAGNSEAVDFDGTDVLEDVTTIVKGSDGTVYELGTDYELEVKQVATDGTKKDVDSIVDAGTYEVTVKPLTFKFETPAPNSTLTITVNPVNITRLVAKTDSALFPADDNGWFPADGDHDDDSATADVPNEFYVSYTGTAVTVPAPMYETIKNGKATYTELSSDLYNVVSIKKDGKTVEEAVDEGTYTVTIALSDAAKSNYGMTSDTYTFTIKKFGHFTDVDSTKWYSVAVEQAYSQWYINGISNTNLFAPEAQITRADAVCILFNMAGGDNISADFSYSEITGYNTGFNDVDGHAYFAKALAWAKAFGVANGSNGNFRPYDQITREEFASLLANYAKAMGKFEAADASALDGVSDANTVSDWAEDNVAWAVENGIMGNGGFVAGQSNIIRAEVAAMAVNYQPEMIRDDVDPR